MIFLPKNIPTRLASELDESLRAHSLPELVSNFSNFLLRVFAASEVVGIVEIGRVGEQSSRPISYAGTVREDAPPEFSGKLLFNWIQAGVHRKVAKDLTDRMSPVSYSAHSWPYPRFQGTQFGSYSELYNIPRQYCLLIPFSSYFIVSSDREKQFAGYFALLFDEFPAYQDDVVQLIVTLPVVLSESVAVFIREQALSEDYLASYLTDAKNHLHMSRELLGRLKTDKKSAPTVAKLDAATTRMLLQTNALLLAAEESSKGLEVHPKPASLNEVISEVSTEVRPLFDAGKVSLRLDLDTTIPKANIDRNLFPAVLRSLLGNALVYSLAGKEVSVRTVVGGDHTVILEISDYGIGVPEGEQQQIFQKFVRGSNTQGIPGSGVGLFIAKRIVESHGGQIDIENDEEGRTSFVVTLPSL